ncbi:MAG: HPF/RaiA family ribosome-associated protein, partial [Melioribacteraceae bacterium]|nr:HPF/RaiA family ribosome-associated protein [Melioribacteraceae bacterium]
ANVILSYTHLKGSIKTVEITISVPGKTFTAEDTAEEFKVALSKTITKLEKQLRTLKSKRMSKGR